MAAVRVFSFTLLYIRYIIRHKLNHQGRDEAEAVMPLWWLSIAATAVLLLLYLLHSVLLREEAMLPGAAGAIWETACLGCRARRAL